MVDESNIRSALAQVTLPDGGPSVMDECVSSLVVRGTMVGLMLTLPPEHAAHYSIIERDIRAALRAVGVQECKIIGTSHDATSNTPVRKAVWQDTPLPHVKRVIAVASGKGGVGKSTITALLARHYSQQGMRVGVLDADITGPSQAHIFGLSGKPELDGSIMLPLMVGDVAVMSVAFLLEQDQAAIMRGPMVSKTLQKLLRGTRWGTEDAPLDILFVDLPPGTGDVHLSLMQQLPLGAHNGGAIIVTTPQELALLDARRCISMFNKINVPLLGVIENMSYIENAGMRMHPFGQGGGARLAEHCGAPLLTSLPLDAALQQAADEGRMGEYMANNIAEDLIHLASIISG